MSKKKLIVIVGPNASGKSELAVRLAKKFNGEIISADSRQVYRGLDISTGKITKKEMRGIHHHLLDVANPKKQFTVVDFKKLAENAVKNIVAHGKIPILVGGTGFWVDAVVYGLNFPQVAPNLKLRKKLEKKSVAELLKILQKLDPRRTKTIEQKNPRRLIRAIEIAKAIGHAPKIKRRTTYKVLWLGTKLSKRELQKRIHKRLLKRLQEGMVEEARRLRRGGLPWKKFYELGLEYKYLADYLRHKVPRKEMQKQLERAINDYARRQIMWWKKNLNICWIKNVREAERLIKKFI